MTRTQYAKFIEKELQALNQKIDLKVINAVGYNDDARRHKMLRNQIKMLRRRSLFSRFGKLVSAFALF